MGHLVDRPGPVFPIAPAPTARSSLRRPCPTTPVPGGPAHVVVGFFRLVQFSQFAKLSGTFDRPFHDAAERLEDVAGIIMIGRAVAVRAKEPFEAAPCPWRDLRWAKTPRCPRRTYREKRHRCRLRRLGKSPRRTRRKRSGHDPIYGPGRTTELSTIPRPVTFRPLLKLQRADVTRQRQECRGQDDCQPDGPPGLVPSTLFPLFACRGPFVLECCRRNACVGCAWLARDGIGRHAGRARQRNPRGGAGPPRRRKCGAGVRWDSDGRCVVVRGDIGRRRLVICDRWRHVGAGRTAHRALEKSMVPLRPGAGLAAGGLITNRRRQSLLTHSICLPTESARKW